MTTEDPVTKAADNEVEEWIKEMARSESRQGPGSDLAFAPATSRVAVELIRIRVEMTAIRQTLQAMAKR
jgi:hypothetical protein